MRLGWVRLGLGLVWGLALGWVGVRDGVTVR